MENDLTATNGSEISAVDANDLLSSFDPSYETQNTEYVSASENSRLNNLLRNPEQIDELTDDEADALYEEGNRIYCKGGYDYMMVNATHDDQGVQYAGVVNAQDRTWTAKAGLKQMAHDIVIRNAAIQGVDALANLLNGDNGKRLGWSGEQYVKATMREKAARIKDVGAVGLGSQMKASLANWWNSWTLGTETNERSGGSGAQSRENMLQFGPDADVAYESCNWDWSDTDNDEANAILNDAIDDAVRTGFTRYRRVFDENGKPVGDKVDVQKTTYKDRQQFAEAVYASPNHVFKSQNGDIFAANIVGRDKKTGNIRYRIELARGGETENCQRIVSLVENKNQNERNAMNGIIMREMFNENPELLKWYRQYDASRRDNATGMFNRKGDVDGLLTSFMADFAPYAKGDSELSPHDRFVRDQKVLTFHQLCEVLALDDKREGFRTYNNWVAKLGSGVGNTVLDFAYELGGLFSASGHQYRKWLWDSWGSTSEENYLNQFKEWAEEDLRAVTDSELFDQGSAVGFIGGEAAKLFAFSAMMKASSLGTVMNIAGKGVNATGRGAKLVGLTKAGQKLKSIGAAIQRGGRAVGGGTTVVAKGKAVGFRKIDVPTNGKLPKGAVKIGDAYYVRDIQKVKQGNFFAEHNAKAAKLDADLTRSLEQQKAVAAEMGGKIGVSEEYVNQIYGKIAELDKEIEKTLGGMYSQTRIWATEIANELPAIMTVGAATAAQHTAMGAYKVGEGFVERDANGIAINAKFDPKPFDTVKEYAAYDAAGNAVFLFHVNRLLDGILKGTAGSAKVQASARSWQSKVIEMYQNGEYNKASALVAMLNQELRRRAVSSAMMGLTGAGMTSVSLGVQNAEDRRLEHPDGVVLTAGDFALNEDQAVEVLKSGLRMAAGGAAVGEVAGSVRKVKNGETPYLDAWRRAASTKELDALSRDSWAIAAGIAHKRGKSVIRYEDLSDDPLTATQQVRYQSKKDEAEYREVSSETYNYMARIMDSIAKRMNGHEYEGYDSIRSDMANKYGETYAKIMDGIIEHIKKDRSLTLDFGMRYATEARVNYEKVDTNKAFKDYAPTEVMRGIEKLLGVRGRRPKDNGDGTFSLNFDVDGKNGWLNLKFRPADFESMTKTVNPDGTVKFNAGWATDVMNGLERKDLDNFTEKVYGDLMDKVSKLPDEIRNRLRSGEDVNGILSDAYDRGARGTGRFDVEVDGTKVATMEMRKGELHISDFAHETAHGFIATLRDRGYFDILDKDGKRIGDKEDFLRKRYGGSGNEWEELFIKDLLTGREDLMTAAMAQEGIDRLEASPFTRMLGAFSKMMHLDTLFKSKKPVRSEVEKFLDKTIEEAKNAREDEIIDERADEIRENVESAEPEVAKTEEQTALVVSQTPVPDAVFMQGVKPEDRKAREKELNDSGFYYDSQYNVWVNERSAPTLYHRAVNEAIATKVKTRREQMQEAYELWKQVQGGKMEMAQKVLAIRRIKELVQPEQFTKSERDHLGIIVSQFNEPLGVVNSKDGIITDGASIKVLGTTKIPDGAKVVPFEHDLYGRWATRAVKRGMSDKKMVAVHNMPPEYAELFIDRGETAGISVAIMPEGVTHNAFGMVSFMFGRKSVDPKENPDNFLFDRDMGLPVYSDFETHYNSEGKQIRNIDQGVNDEAYWAENEDGTLKVFDTPELVAEAMAAHMRNRFDNYPTGADKRNRVKTIEALKKMITDGKLPNIYGEDKLARLVKMGEVIGASVPHFSDAAIAKLNAETKEVVDDDAVRQFCEKTGAEPEKVVKAIGELIDEGQYIPEPFASLVKRVDSVPNPNEQFDRIVTKLESLGVPVVRWETDELTWNDKTIEPRTKALKELQDKVPETRFNVVGVKGASRYFGERASEIQDKIRIIVADAVTKADEGTRAGLKSSKNAEVNNVLTGAGPTKVGPFILHVGGTDGDKGVRLEYEGKKPKMPQGFLKRSDEGEQFHVYDIMGNAVRQDDVLAKAYPEIMSASIYFSNTKKSAELGIKEPAWRDDNIFILPNEDGQIVVNRKKWNDRLAPEQFAQALVGLIQKTEGWEERIRTSDAKISEALIPNRAKRMNSRLSFWLTDPRLIVANGVGPLVEKALRKRLGDRVDDKMLKELSAVIWEEIDNSVRQFAGEAESRFLASRFGMKEDELADYSKAEQVLKDTLVTLDSKNLTSVQQTKKNLQYWDEVIAKAVDAFVFKGHQGSHGDGRTDIRTIRPELREAIADEMLEGIIERILEGTRRVRTEREAKISKVGVGEKSEKVLNLNQGSAPEYSEDNAVDQTGEPTEGGRLAAGFAMMNGEDGWDNSAGGRTLVTSGMTVVNAVDAGMASEAKSIDAKWEINKVKVAELVKSEVAKIRQALLKDPTKAESAHKTLVEKLYKIVEDNSNTTDFSVKQSLLNEAILMSQKGSWRVVANRRTPKTLMVEAASARLAKSWLDGKRSPEEEWKVRNWVETQAEKIGIPESRRANFAQDVMNSAIPVAETISKRFEGRKNDARIIKAAGEEAAVAEVTERIVRGAVGGYNVGKRGQDAASRAVAEAKRLQAREVKDARGMGTAELNSLLGGDIVKGIENLKDLYRDGDGLATASIKAFSDNLMARDNRFAGMNYDEFTESQVARAELASTVAAWLKETAKRLGYGQVREWAMREAARMQKQPQTFGSVHMTMAKYADMLSESIGKQNVGELLDSIDSQIDTYADGGKAAAQSFPDYERKIAPRLQDYWKYVKKVMRMTEDAVEKEVAHYNNILKLSDRQLLELSNKDASDLDANEELLARDRAMMRLNALTRFGAMKYKTYSECRSIFDGQMAHDLAGGIQRHMVMRNARLAEDGKIRQAFIGELTSIRRNLKGDDYDKLYNGTKGRNFLTFSVADLFKRMSLYLHEGSDAWNFIDSFRQEMSLGHIEQTTFVSKWEGEMRKACERIYGTNFEKLIPDMMLKREEYDKFSRSAWYIPENGQKVEVACGNHTKKVVLAKQADGTVPTNLPNHLSKANLIYIYAACQQADMQVNNAIWHRDAQYLREIEDIIGPEGIAMAGWLTSAYGEIRKRLSPISEEISGMPVLSPDERYCPLSFEQDQVSNDERRFTSSPFPSFLTRRVTHDSLRLNENCDAFRMFEDKIQDSGHYIGFARVIDRMNSTLKHPKVQTAYAQLYGTKAKNDIYAQLADALNGGRKNADTLLSGVRNFVTATSLFGNFGSALKQLEGIGGWSVEMGLGQWVKGLIRTPMTSAEVRQGVRELIDSGLFLTRDNEGISEAMVALMNSCEGMPEGPMSKSYRWYKRHGMDITKWVDKIASMSMAGQYYTGRKNWYIEHGLKEEDAKRKALADTDYAIQTTQQSGRSEFLHSAQRNGTAGKMITQFSGPAFVRWGIECETWHRAMVMGDKGAWGKLASRLIALHIICPSILALAGGISGMMFRRDDQKMKDIVERTEKDIIANCITGPMSGWFIWGQVINAFAYENVLPNVKGAQNKVHFEAPVLSKLHSLQQMTSKMYKDVIKAAPWDYFSPREQRMIREDAWRIFQMLIPASRVAEPVIRNAK